jgi:hypothetical protein
MNPYPKAPSGSYKNLLVQGLRNIGENAVADEFEAGRMKLAIASSITGNVKLFPELKSACIFALASVNEMDGAMYYGWGIGNGDFVVASSNVDFIYNADDKAAAAHAKRMSEASENQVLNPYFTT